MLLVSGGAACYGICVGILRRLDVASEANGFKEIGLAWSFRRICS